MALKRIITKAEYEKLAPHFKAEYKLEDGGENAILDLTDYEDPKELKAAKDRVNGELKTVRAEAKKLADDLKALTDERDQMLAGSIPKADAEKLRVSYEKKITDLRSELEQKLGTRNTQLQKILVDNVAQTLAGKISTAPAVILPHIKSRLVTEEVNGEYVTRVIDKDGKPSALSIQDLEKEFVANDDFKAIIVGSKANGGGAGGGGGGGGAGSGNKIDWSKPSDPKAIVAAIKANGGPIVRPGEA